MPELRDLRLLAQKEDWSVESLQMVLYILLITGHFDDVWVTPNLLERCINLARYKKKESE